MTRLYSKCFKMIKKTQDKFKPRQTEDRKHFNRPEELNQDKKKILFI